MPKFRRRMPKSKLVSVAGSMPTDTVKGIKGDKGDKGDQGNAGSDATVTKSAVEAVLTGEISSHTHAGGGGLTQAQARRIGQ